MIASESNYICIWLAERLPKDTFGLVVNSVTGFNGSSLAAFFCPDWLADPPFLYFISYACKAGSFPS